jgi:hypothetical protein
MNLTLTLELLLRTFEAYNQAIWPMQVVAYVLGIGALFLALRPSRFSDGILNGVLSFLWLWNGIGFFMLAFGPAYTPAYIFGALFVVQAALFLRGVAEPHVSFRYTGDVTSLVGILLVAYAMIGYPLLGMLLGHRYPQSPPFGLTPCPTAVFTFGLFLLTDEKVPTLLIAIPFVWALGGILPASVGFVEDVGLIGAGVVGTGLILYRNRRT